MGVLNLEQSVSVNKGMTVDRAVKLTLILLGMFVVVLALFSLRTEATVYVWGPSDYNITGQESYLPGDQIYILGNVNVNSTGNLSLNNTNVQFNATGKEITVKSGGTFYVTDADNNPATSADWTIITTNTGVTDWKFNASAGSNVLVRNSLMGMIGFNQPAIPEKCLKIYSTNTTFLGNTFTNNRCIFYVGPGGLLVARNNSLNSGAGYQLTNAFYVDNNGSLESSNNQISMGGAGRYAYYLMFDSNTNSTYDSSTYADTVIRCVGCVAKFDNLTMNVYYFYAIYANSSETRLVVNTFTDNPASANTMFSWVKEGAQVWVNYGTPSAHFMHFFVNKATMTVKYVTINSLYVSGGAPYYWISVDNNGKFYADHLTYNNGYQNTNAWVLWANGGSTVSISNSNLDNHYNGFNIKGGSSLTLNNVSMVNFNWPYTGPSRYGIVINGNSNLTIDTLTMRYYRYDGIVLFNSNQTIIDRLTLEYTGNAGTPADAGQITSNFRSFILRNSTIRCGNSGFARNGIALTASIPPPDAPGGVVPITNPQIEVYDTLVTDAYNHGLYVPTAIILKVSGCAINHIGWDGIYLDTPTAVEVSNSVFQYNSEYSGGSYYAIYQYQGDSPTNGFVYKNNSFYYNYGWCALRIYNVKGAEISGNYFSSDFYQGEIFLEYSTVNITGNTFNGTYWSGYYNVRANYCRLNKFNDNIVGSTQYAYSFGLYLYEPTTGVTEIKGNNFQYNYYHLYMITDNGGYRNVTYVIKDNYFGYSNSGHAIYWDQYNTAKVTLDNNTFEGSNYGLYLNMYYNMPMPPPGLPAQEYNWTIKNNVFKNLYSRFLFIYSYSGNYDTMIIQGNKFLKTNSGMEMFVGIHQKSLIMFKGNTYQGLNSDNGWIAVWLYNTRYVTFENEAISNMHVGIEIRNSCSNIIIRNSVFNNSQNVSAPRNIRT